MPRGTARLLTAIEHARVIAKLRRAMAEDQPFIVVLVHPLPGAEQSTTEGAREGYELRHTYLDLTTNADPVTLCSVLRGVLEEEERPDPTPALRAADRKEH